MTYTARNRPGQAAPSTFAADDRSIEEPALTRLVERGEGHPRVTMPIAQQTHLAAVLLETHEITTDVVEQGYLGALRAERVNNEQTLERIRRAHRLGLEIARRLALREPAYRGLPRGAVRRALEELRDAAIIETHGRGDWRFTNPLLRPFWKSCRRSKSFRSAPRKAHPAPEDHGDERHASRG